MRPERAIAVATYRADDDLENEIAELEKQSQTTDDEVLEVIASETKKRREAIEQFCLAAAKSNVEYVEEVGGGLNFKRKKFLELFDSVSSGEVEEIIIAHKDRLARFGFDLLQHTCDNNKTKLTVINIEKLSPEQEMVQDLMTIIHCFSSRLYGLRNYKKIVKDAIANGK